MAYGGASPPYAAHGQTTLNGHRGNGHGGTDRAGAASATGGTFDPHRASTGELVSQAAGQISTLVRSELALGRAELLDKGRKLGLGGGLLAAAGILGLSCLGLLITLCVVLLDRAWPSWLAVLVTLLAIGTLTLLLAGAGINRLRKGASAPTETAHSLRDDIESMKHAFRDGRSANHAGHERRHLP